MLLTRGTRVGPYRITGPLGSGGMGVVYSAEDERLRRPVAIKFLSRDALNDPRAYERFQQEARTASSLNHPNISIIHDIGEHAGEPFLVMELIDGQALSSRIESGPLAVQEAVPIAVSIADALNAAHQGEIVHRDVKPANILITTRGDAKLLDFGIARLSAAVDATATNSETTAGTVAYMSPEQARNEPLDHRTDLFSLGAVLYEMVTGVRPFAGVSPALIFDAVLNRPPRPPSEVNPRVPAELDRVILRALEKDRSLRYQSAADFAADLKRLLRSEPVASVSAARRPRRSMAIFVAAGVAGIAAVLGYVAWRSPSDDDRRQVSLEQITESGDVLAAAISNEGRYVAYTEATADGIALNVRQVQTKATVTIVPAGTYQFRGIAFSPDSAYVYATTVKPSSLLRVPTLGGQPATILEDIGSAVAVSPDGRELAYVRAKGPLEAELVVVSADGSNLRSVAVEKRSPTATPAWSPDGKTIAWPPASPASEFGFTLVSANGEHKESINLPGWKYIESVVWLPSGRGLVLTAEEESRELTGRHQILEVTYPQLKIKRLTNDLGDYHFLAGNPDVALSSVQLGRRSGISVGTLESPDALRRVGTGGSDGSRGLTWLPDGRLVFTDTYTIGWIMNADGSGLRPLLSDRRSASAPFSCGHLIGYTVVHRALATVFLLDLDSGRSRRLTDVSLGQPTCSPDGSALIYTDNEVIKSVSTTTASEPIVMQRNAHDARVSPDGRWLAAHTRSSDSADNFVVYSMKDGSLIRKFPGAVANFQWDSTSAALLYSRGAGNVDNLWRAPIDGQPATQVTHFTSDIIFSFAISSDRRLAIARGETANNVVVLRK
jgi:eukaryotic-like serine/threonine-protein kinase